MKSVVAQLSAIDVAALYHYHIWTESRYTQAHGGSETRGAGQMPKQRVSVTESGRKRSQRTQTIRSWNQLTPSSGLSLSCGMSFAGYLKNLVVVLIIALMSFLFTFFS